MRIETFGPTLATLEKQVTTTKVADLAKQANQPSTQNPLAGDRTTFTSKPAAVQSLTQSALQSAPARAAKVAALKQEVNGGQYKLDAGKIAEALSNGAL